MAEKNDRFKYLKLERNFSYPFPVIVAIISIFIFVASYSILGIGLWNRNLYLTPDWNSTALSGELVESINTENAYAMINPIFDCLYIVMLLAPLLIAFNLAQGYSNGQIRTLLSYPISRRTVVLSKSGFIVLLLSLAGTIGALFSLIVFYPFSIDLYTMLILIVTFWVSTFVITATCTILAIVSRNALITAFVGVGLWEIFAPLWTQPNVHPVILYLLFPFFLAISHVNPQQPPFHLVEKPVIDLILGWGCSIAFSIMLLILSVIIFKKQEI
jgi:ABC-type transport system involved in multi-copper enzyme maturation permease subunit